MTIKTQKILISFLAGFLLLWGCEEFLRRKVGGIAGSYPDVESWEIYARESEVFDALLALNQTNPNFQPPDTFSFVRQSQYWCHINLYYPDTKEIVHAWTRPVTGTGKTTLAFVSLEKYDHSEKRRLINRDFWYLPNKYQIRKFKTTFVDKIRAQIDINAKTK